MSRISRVSARPDVVEAGPPYDAWLATNLRTIKTARNLSYEAMCHTIGMDRKSLWRIMNRRHSATIITASAIASSLGMDLLELFVAPAIFKAKLPK